MICEGKNSDAVTVLELIIAVLLVFIISAFAFHMAGGSGNTENDHPCGVLYTTVQDTGHMLALSGTVTGYQDLCENFDDFSLYRPDPDPTNLGAVRFTVQLMIGDMGGVDMDRAVIVFDTKGVTERLGMQLPVRIVNPGWSIVRKLHMVPYHEADSDNILEPGEQFDIVAYPSARLPPYTNFDVSIEAEGGVPFNFKRSVPAKITRVMELG